MAIKDNIINTFKQGSLLIKLIYINAAVFVAMGIVEILSKWFNLDSGWMSYLMLPSYVPRLIRQLWSVVTYMFMHAGVEHVLFNMLALYWFGQLFASFYSQKNLVGVYIFGGLCGALMYVSAFNLIPYYQSLRDCGYLVGASASVMAIMVACAAYAPDYRIRLFLVGDVRL